jgi:hypothetical protein
MVVAKEAFMKADEMSAVLARWKSSGQSLRSFGQREGIGYSKLIYWRRRLQEKAPRSEKIELARVHARVVETLSRC